MRTTDGVSSAEIRKAHRAALKIADRAVRVLGPDERFAWTLVCALDERSAAELRDLVEEFAARVAAFAEARPEDRDGLHQVVIHFSPVGRKSHG